MRGWFYRREARLRAKAEAVHSAAYPDHALMWEPERSMCVECDAFIWRSSTLGVLLGRSGYLRGRVRREQVPR